MSDDDKNRIRRFMSDPRVEKAGGDLLKALSLFGEAVEDTDHFFDPKRDAEEAAAEPLATSTATGIEVLQGSAKPPSGGKRRFCEDCGHAMGPTARFCAGCGRKST